MLLVLVLLIANNIGFNFLDWGKNKYETKTSQQNTKGESQLETYLSIHIEDHTITLDDQEVTLDELKEKLKDVPNKVKIKLFAQEAKRVTYQEVIEFLQEYKFTIIEE